MKSRAISWVVCVLSAALSTGVLLLARPPRPDNFATWTDANVALVLIAAALWIIYLTIRAYPAAIGLNGYALGVAALAALAIWGADKILLSLFLDRHPDYRRWVHSTQWSRLALGFASLAWPAITMALSRQNALLEEKLKTGADATAALREAELFRLRQQLQPHFLFNSLNAVSSLILLSPDKAVDTIGRLSGFLRTSVKRDTQELVPLDEELDYIRNYLEIEGVRFGDRLRVRIESDADGEALLPPAILQPLIENAVKFGIYGTTGTVEIALLVTTADNMLQLQISNPFDPQAVDRRGTGFGLEGVRRRLYLLYARTDLVDTSAQNNVFSVYLKIPQTRV